jgi:hypothetical protein
MAETKSQRCERINFQTLYFEAIERYHTPVRIGNKMDQRSIVLSFAMKGVPGMEIDNDLGAPLGFDVIGCRTVTHFLHKAKFPPSNPPISLSEENPGFDESNEAIFRAFTEHPLASIHQSLRLTHLLPTLVYRQLTQFFGFHVRYLRWIPHQLSDSQKSDRVERSRQFLCMFEIQRVRCRHDIVTLDEFWFHLSIDDEIIWLQSDEKVPEAELPTIQSTNGCSR